MEKSPCGRVILPRVPVAMSPRRCPICEEEYHGTVLTERRDRRISSVTYSPCPACGTVSYPTPGDRSPDAGRLDDDALDAHR